MMLKYDEWFPTVIGWADCPFIDELNESITPNLKSYLSFNEAGFAFNWHDHKKFKKFSKWVNDCVNEYAAAHKFPNTKLNCFESWCRDYKIGDFNTHHIHTGSIVSVNFYLNTDPTDVGTRFKSPVTTDMMNPLEQDVSADFKVDNGYTKWTFLETVYPPIQGRLLLWRSYLEHYVLPKKQPGTRIIMSGNYK